MIKNIQPRVALGYALSVAAFFLLALMTLHSLPKKQNAKFWVGENASITGNPRKTDTDMPFYKLGLDHKVMNLEYDLTLSLLSPRTFRIIPDDFLRTLRVNDVQVDLSEIPLHKRKDVNRGFSIDLSAYLNSGSNHIVVEFKNYGGPTAFNMEGQYTGLRAVFLASAWLLLLLWFGLQVNQYTKVSKLHLLFYALIFIGAAIRVWYIFTYNPVDHIWSDPQRHWEQGNDTLRIDLMSMTDPIGYQLFVGMLAKLTLKIPALVAFYCSVLSLLGAWAWYRFLRELQSSKTLALAGWAFFSLLPSWITIYGYFMQETLMIPMMGAALWATWRCRRKGDLASFLVMVTIWALAGLVRGIAIPMAAVACSWLWIIQEHRIPKAVWSTAILVFILGPLIYRSYATVHHFAPHGMGHLNVIYSSSGKKEIKIHAKLNGAAWVYGFGSPSTGAKPFEPFSDWKTERKGVVSVNIDLAKGKEDWDKAIDAIDLNMSDRMWLLKENLIFLFFASSWPDNNPSRFLDQINIGSRFLWAPMFLVIVIGSVVLRRRMQGQWMLAGVLGVWFFMQGLMFLAINEGRYRKPFEGLAVAQLVLLIAAAKGRTRPGAPTPSWDLALERVRRKKDDTPSTENSEHSEQKEITP